MHTEADAPSAERFHLSKWYMDCVSEHGEVLIGYWAELRWRRMAAHYASVMLFVDGQLHERSSLRPGPAPQHVGEILSWRCDALETRGAWQGAAPVQVSRVLFRRDNRRLEWHCLQPVAEARVRCGERQISGPGYTERITLSVAPWELPIEELRWGRAHFTGRSVVWIDWSGAVPFRLVLLDAKEVEGVQVTDDSVSMPGTLVTLSGRRVLRKGPAGATSAGSIPGARRALSKAGLLIDEHKWLSSAMLEEGGKILHGKAVHEVVRWR